MLFPTTKIGGNENTFVSAIGAKPIYVVFVAPVEQQNSGHFPKQCMQDRAKYVTKHEILLDWYKN